MAMANYAARVSLALSGRTDGISDGHDGAAMIALLFLPGVKRYRGLKTNWL